MEDLISLRLKGTRPTDHSVYRNRYRSRRMTKLMLIIDEIIATKGSCRIIDVGGRYDFWRYQREKWADRPLSVTLVNISPTEADNPHFNSEEGDACDLKHISDMSYDLAFSNSVIEHVGSWTKKCLMAAEIRRVAPRYFIQTPNFWFPVEPHFRALFIHWLPRPVRRALIMRYDFAFHKRADCLTEAYRIMDDAELLDRREMQTLFPDGVIYKELVAGVFAKSFIAIR